MKINDNYIYPGTGISQDAFTTNFVKSKLPGFGEYQRTFMMIKPDAFERHLDNAVMEGLKTLNVNVTRVWEGKPSREKMVKNYESKMHATFFKGWIDYLTSGKVRGMLIEGDDVISKVLDFKKKFRDLFAPGEKRLNLVHCSDNKQEAEKEILNFFDATV